MSGHVSAAAQMKALLYILENPIEDDLMRKALIDATTGETQWAVFEAFLTDVHPDLALNLHQQPLGLLRDLYRVEYEAWRDAKVTAGGGAWQQVLWQIALDTKAAP